MKTRRGFIKMSAVAGTWHATVATSSLAPCLISLQTSQTVTP